MSRLPPLSPGSLTTVQNVLYNELSATAEKYFGNSFITKTKQGHLVGPFEIYMHVPALAGAFQQTVAGFNVLSGVPARQKEVAILTVGAHFQAVYELYAHQSVALSRTDLDIQEIAQIKDGHKPVAFNREDNAAYDLAQALVTHARPLSAALYHEAELVFGVEGTKTLVHLVAFYSSICILLNAFDVKVPKDK